jgi:hypothetical protein
MKLRLLKKWVREFEGRVQPLVKQIEKLHSVLTNDMVQAVASLTQSINTLAAYAEIKPPAEVAISPSTNAPTTDTPVVGEPVEGAKTR